MVLRERKGFREQGALLGELAKSSIFFCLFGGRPSVCLIIILGFRLDRYFSTLPNDGEIKVQKAL